VPFQRIAVAAGLGAMAPSGLVIHPVFGPWFGLRALIALEGEPRVAPAARLPYRCSGDCEARLAEAVPSRDWRRWAAVRDACRIGREYRYGEDQLEYHYTKNLALLR
jgi:methylmalonic aciduria homocystinuria type C protein